MVKRDQMRQKQRDKEMDSRVIEQTNRETNRQIDRVEKLSYRSMTASVVKKLESITIIF